MGLNKILVALTILIALMAAAAGSAGVFSEGGEGSYQYSSIRGKTITIYGEGLYRHMSAEVAPQGIAQDHVTLFLAVPVLLISLLYAGKGSVQAHFLLTGVLGYFLVTYLFYTVMAMYNSFFLLYVALMGCSFYAFILSVFSLKKKFYTIEGSTRAGGGFLVFSSLSIALLWLSIVVPRLLDGSIYLVAVEHYTTLIVQGLDLGILLPASFISGIALWKKTEGGVLLGPVYLIFLSLLMTALSAKVVAMYLLGYNVIPVIFIIPSFNLLAFYFTARLLVNIKTARS